MAARVTRDLGVAVRPVFVIGVRTCVCAARDMVADCVVRAGTDVRTFVDVARAVAARGVADLAVRAVVARDAEFFTFVRGFVCVRDAMTVLCAVALRDIVVSSRTAALTMPTLTIYAIIKSQVFFIPLYTSDMISNFVKKY